MEKLKPALLGGLVTGVLCIIPFVSTCCCIWAACGGLLAGFLYIRSAPAPVPTSEGAILGAMSGGVGALIYLVIALPLSLVFGAAGMEEQFRRTGVAMPFSGIALVLISVCLVIILILVFSALGGLLAVPIFEKRKGNNVAPPPPQQFGGGPGGFGAA